MGILHAGDASDALRSPFINATLFLALFMLTDPPTTPAKVKGQTHFWRPRRGCGCRSLWALWRIDVLIHRVAHRKSLSFIKNTLIFTCIEAQWKSSQRITA